jgi:predicted AlkP superfamily phosphohydrolase/phosphomutase
MELGSARFLTRALPALRRRSLRAARLALLAALALTARASADPQSGRVIVLGFDGADFRIVDELCAKGELPHLAELRSKGTGVPLGTTVPAESPVSWAALNCGQNPGKTGIPGFIKRELSSSGEPAPALGFQEHAPRRTDAFHVSWLYRQLGARSPAANATIVGIAVAFAFAVLLGRFLRIRRTIAVALSIVLGALGAWGGWIASECIPREIADVVGNPIRTHAFWEPAARAGVRSVVLDGAMSWDREPVEGVQLLAGLGVPDVRGDTGDWFVYTDDPKEIARPPEGRSTPTGGTVFRVDAVDGKIETRIYGPIDVAAIDKLQRERDAITATLAQENVGSARRDALEARKQDIERVALPRLKGASGSEEGRLFVPLAIEVNPKASWLRAALESMFGRRARSDFARVTIDGETQELAAGQWSDWFHLTFEGNALFKTKAITRVKLQSLRDPLALYVDFLQIDPRAEPYWQPVSQPAGFAKQLAKSIGMPYETVGWACMTMPFKDRLIDPATFLEDIEFTRGWREKLLLGALKRDDWRLLVNVESTPDRAQHMMYQFYDSGHPLYDPAKARSTARYLGQDIALSDAIPATYREIDRIVGEVMEQALKPGDTLIVCSDHGFQSYRYSVNLNNWLHEHGYLAVRPGIDLDVDASQADALAFVDWEHTRAYALGLGMIFLNLAGRERDGIVRPEDAPALLDEISRALLATRDGDAPVVRSVYRTSAIHSGAYTSMEADLLTGFEAGYRVGWSTTTGGMRFARSLDQHAWLPGKTLEPNKNNWSGDHVSVAEDLVRGIFFCNRRVDIPDGGVNLLHIAPTVLSILGVGIPTEYDRPPLRFRD